MPFAMLLMLMLHHTDESSSFQRRINAYAIGIRRSVSPIPVIAGILVRPQPKKAPVAINSKHINSWDIPIIIRYSLPMAMLSGSFRKIENRGDGKVTRIAVVITPMMTYSNIPAPNTFHCLS